MDKKYSNEEVNKLIGHKYARWNKRYQLLEEKAKGLQAALEQEKNQNQQLQIELDTMRRRQAVIQILLDVIRKEDICSGN